MLHSFPVLDVTALVPKQLAAAAALFDDMKEKPLLPLHEIEHDPVSEELDERFVQSVLNLPESMFKPDGPFELLRMKMTREPSIRGARA
jgi:hypothetical protein